MLCMLNLFLIGYQYVVTRLPWQIGNWCSDSHIISKIFNQEYNMMVVKKTQRIKQFIIIIIIIRTKSLLHFRSSSCKVPESNIPDFVCLWKTRIVSNIEFTNDGQYKAESIMSESICPKSHLQKWQGDKNNELLAIFEPTIIINMLWFM